MFPPDIDGPHDLPADDDPWAKWLGGALLPFLLVAGGVAIMQLQQIWLPGRGGGAVFRGSAVIAIGLMPMAGALWLHCTNFWGRTPALAPFAPLGLIASVTIFVGSVFYVLLRAFAI